MNKKKLVGLLLAVLSAGASAQPLAPITMGDSSGATQFQKLEAKNKARFFGTSASPGGDQFIYLDDASVKAGSDLSPEIERVPGTRKVILVVDLYSTSRIRLAPEEADLQIGTVNIVEPQPHSRRLDVESTLNLTRPLRVKARSGNTSLD